MSNTSIRLIVGLGNIETPIKAQDIMQDFILLMKLLMSTGHDFRRIGNFLVMLQRLGSEGWKSSF